MSAAANRTAWLIEGGDGLYWSGRKSRSLPAMTSDPNDAVRFARAEDAHRVRTWLLEEHAPLLRVREHAWVASADLARPHQENTP